MPKVAGTNDAEAERLETMLAAREAFEAGFRRSKKANLWRLWRGLTLCVFKRGDGWFGWSVSDNDGPRFSPGGYETEEDTLGALWDATEGAEWR